MTDNKEKFQLTAAIEQVRGILAELEDYLLKWDSVSSFGTETYRPVARRIVLSAQQLEQLVKEKTFSL